MNQESEHKVICLESIAFYRLVEEVVERLSDKKEQAQEKWVSASQAMQMLGISSRTTLQKYRDEGSIRFAQPSRKVILYDRDSINEFLERHTHETF